MDTHFFLHRVILSILLYFTILWIFNVDEQMVAREYISGRIPEEEIKEDFHLSSFVLESIRGGHPEKAGTISANLRKYLKAGASAAPAFCV